MLDLGQHEADLGGICLHRRLGEIRCHRGKERFLLLDQHPLELAELALTGVDRAQPAGVVGFAEQLDDERDRFNGWRRGICHGPQDTPTG